MDDRSPAWFLYHFSIITKPRVFSILDRKVELSQQIVYNIDSWIPQLFSESEFLVGKLANFIQRLQNIADDQQVLQITGVERLFFLS